MSRLTAEQKAEIIEKLAAHDTYEMNLMGDIRWGRPNEILAEVEAEQQDPPDQRQLTVAVRGIVSSMINDGNLDDTSQIPPYLLEQAAALAS